MKFYNEGGKKLFYGWIVVFASAISLALGLGMFNSTNSVFVKPVCDALGFTRAGFTMHRTIITLVSALLMPLYARLIRRFGVKKLLIACSVLLGFIVASYSFATNLFHFYILAALNGAFFNGVGFMTIGVLVNNWFTGKKGLALGLAYAGSGLGGAVMVPVISWLIEYIGWRWAYQFMGAFGITVLLPVVILLIRDNPGEMGLAPLPAGDDRAERAVRGTTLREAFRMKQFWALIAAFMLINAFAASTNTHSAPYLNDIGYSAAYVSSVVSLMMVLLTVGKIALGIAYDRFGVLAGNIVIAVACLAYPVFALLAAQPAMPWLYAVFVGLASCGVSVPVTILIDRYFGNLDFPAIFGFCSMVASLASSAAVPAMGVVFDMTGSYRPAWFILFGFSVVIAVSLIGVEIVHRGKNRQE